MFVDLAVVTIYLIALISMMGVMICRYWILPSEAFSMPPVLRISRYFFYTCLSIVTISSVISFIMRSLMMNDGIFDNFDLILSTVLLQTHYGHMMLLRFIVIALLWVIALSAKNNSRQFNLSMSIIFLLILVIAFTSSTISHAGDNGDFTLSVLIDWLHIIATAGWGGSIIAVVVCVFPLYSLLPSSPVFFADLIHRLSVVATISS